MSKRKVIPRPSEYESPFNKIPSDNNGNFNHVNTSNQWSISFPIPSWISSVAILSLWCPFNQITWTMIKMAVMASCLNDVIKEAEPQRAVSLLAKLLSPLPGVEHRSIKSSILSNVEGNHPCSPCLWLCLLPPYTWMKSLLVVDALIDLWGMWSDPGADKIRGTWGHVPPAKSEGFLYLYLYLYLLYF